MEKVVVHKNGMDPVTFGAEVWLDSTNGSATSVELFPGEAPKSKTKKLERDSKVLYVNPIYGPGGRRGLDISPHDVASILDGASKNMDRKLSIFSAHDLINVDMFDKSDPYCIVKWCGNQIGKTRTIDNTCFPIWNEEFIVTLPETNEGLLRIDLYDHDTFGKHKPLGSVEIKVGGKSNPNALRACADYSFPDAKFTGHITMQIDHIDSRFATEDTQAFKDKYMGMTYREHRAKHVFEQWTRIYLLVATTTLWLFAAVVIYSAIYVADCPDDQYLIKGYMALGMFTLLVREKIFSSPPCSA